jgi:hypothetical protein
MKMLRFAFTLHIIKEKSREGTLTKNVKELLNNYSQVQCFVSS